MGETSGSRIDSFSFHVKYNVFYEKWLSVKHASISRWSQSNSSSGKSCEHGWQVVRTSGRHMAKHQQRRFVYLVWCHLWQAGCAPLPESVESVSRAESRENGGGTGNTALHPFTKCPSLLKSRYSCLGITTIAFGILARLEPDYREIRCVRDVDVAMLAQTLQPDRRQVHVIYALYLADYVSGAAGDWGKMPSARALLVRIPRRRDAGCRSRERERVSERERLGADLRTANARMVDSRISRIVINKQYEPEPSKILLSNRRERAQWSVGVKLFSNCGESSHNISRRVCEYLTTSPSVKSLAQA